MWLMRFAFVWLSLVTLATPDASAQPALTIVVHEQFGARSSETVEYIQQDRRRRDSENGIIITRCDLDRVYALNLADRTFDSGPVWHPPTGAELFTAAITSRTVSASKSPTLQIETTTTDTSERKTLLGRAARRVVTLERRIPLDDAARGPSETRIDGWYTDLDTDISCERSYYGKPRASVLVGSTNRRPIVVFKDIGPRETGYPVRLETTSRSTARVSDGTAREHTLVTTRVVTEISTAVLDPALFEIPPGFREAVPPPVPFAVRMNYAWQQLKVLIAEFFY